MVYNCVKCMMKLASNFGKQIPRNRLQQFVFRLHLQNLWCSKSFSRCQSKEDAVFFWQTLKSSRRSPESRPACFTPEKLSVRGWDIIVAFINWTSSFEALKKNCSNQPHWSQWTLSFNREMHCDTTGMYEKEIESADLLYVADSEQTHLQNERVQTHF